MKKTLTLMLAAILAASALVSCGGEKKKENDVPAKGAQVQEAPITDEENIDSVEDEATETEENAQEDISAEEVAVMPPEPGTVTDLNYESRYLGIGFNVDESWSFADEAMRRDMLDPRAELDFEDVEGIIKDYDVYPDVVASSSVGESISILFSGVPEGVELDPVTLNHIAESSMQGTLESYSRLIAQVPVESAIKEVTVAGITYTGYTTSFEAGGVKVVQEAAVIPCGRYVAMVSVSSNSGSVADIWSCFYRLTDAPAADAE